MPHLEGGYSSTHFLETFNMKYDKDISIFGVTRMSDRATTIHMLYAIILVRYLKKNMIAIDKGIPDYASFEENHKNSWLSFRQ